MSQAAPPQDGAQVTSPDVETLNPGQKIAQGLAALKDRVLGRSGEDQASDPYTLPDSLDRAELLKRDSKLRDTAAGIVGQRQQAEIDRLKAENATFQRERADRERAEAETQRQQERDLLANDPWKAAEVRLAALDAEDATKADTQQATSIETELAKLREDHDRPLHDLLDKLSPEERANIEGKTYNGETAADSRRMYLEEVTAAMARDAVRATTQRTEAERPALEAQARSQAAQRRGARQSDFGGGAPAGIDANSLTPSQKIAQGLAAGASASR